MQGRRGWISFVVYNPQTYSWQCVANIPGPVRSACGTRGDKKSLRETVILDQPYAVSRFKLRFHFHRKRRETDKRLTNRVAAEIFTGAAAIHPQQDRQNG